MIVVWIVTVAVVEVLGVVAMVMMAVDVQEFKLSGYFEIEEKPLCERSSGKRPPRWPSG